MVIEGSLVKGTVIGTYRSEVVSLVRNSTSHRSRSDLFIARDGHVHAYAERWSLQLARDSHSGTYMVSLARDGHIWTMVTELIF